MRIAILSDIHGNLEALHSVLADMQGRDIAQVYSLGDNVGYGPDPQKVVDLVRELGVLSVMGNHELALAHPRQLSWFNPVARRSLEATRAMLSESALTYIRKLRAFRVRAGCRFVHGFPPAATRVYLFQVSEGRMGTVMDNLPEPICFVGHTHELEIITRRGRGLERRRLSPGRHPMDAANRYLLNIGSVGQPRDGDNRAKYAVWDPTERVLELHRVSYDAEATAAKILAAGLPAAHARMLL